jgi:hypothetical protein
MARQAEIMRLKQKYGEQANAVVRQASCCCHAWVRLVSSASACSVT